MSGTEKEIVMANERAAESVGHSEHDKNRMEVVHADGGFCTLESHFNCSANFISQALSTTSRLRSLEAISARSQRVTTPVQLSLAP